MSTPPSPSPTWPPFSSDTTPPPSPLPPTIDSSAPLSPPLLVAASPNGTFVDTPQPTPSGGLPRGTLAGLIVGVVLGALIMLIGVGIFVIFYKRRKKKLAHNYSLDSPSPGPKGKERPVMNWSTRMKIALDAARGLAYLHEDCQPKIIHRDIKAANILLDNSFEAKVADFGLAKYSLDTDTHVSTRVMGTFGYMAPEYASSGKLTGKSDVFSFGVVLLELITGCRPVDKSQPFFDDSLVDWARPLLSQALVHRNFEAFVDPRLHKGYDSSEMTRMVACAAACVRHSARNRPRMSQIVRALEGNISLDDLNEGITPGHSTVFGSYESSDYSSTQYREEMKKFRKVALESQELGSSEYSAVTSEYGVNPSSSSSEGQHPTQVMEKSKADKETKDVIGSL